MEQEDYPSITRMFGIELEFFLTDREGRISNKADQLINDAKDKMHETEIKKEAGKSMIEVVTFPHRSSREAFSTFIDDFESVLYEAEVNDIGIFNYGTYPGKNDNLPREGSRYASISRIFGEKQLAHAGRCIGFHFHWSLPRNSFNQNTLYFYPDINERKKEKIVNLHNLYAALDPAISTLMQSSPYYEGKLLGKDARVIVYRGDPAFKYKEGRFSKYPDFGVLNKYVKDFSGLEKDILERSGSFKNLLQENNLSFSDFAKKTPSFLDSSWKPVKVSINGTIESRGADMNSMDKVVALSSILKSASRHLQNEFIRIKPGKTGNNEPFKLEDDILYVPEHDELVNLQKKSALSGFEDRSVLKYCKSLLGFIKSIVPAESMAPLRIFSKMAEEEKTTSDNVINFVKKKQGSKDFKNISDDTAREFAIYTSEKIYKDIVITKKMCEMNLGFG